MSTTKKIELKAKVVCNRNMTFTNDVQLYWLNDELKVFGYKKTNLKEIGEIWTQETARDERQRWIFEHLKETIMCENDYELDSVRLSECTASTVKELY